MKFIFDRKEMKEKIVIDPGEYHTTNCDRIICTILGSCVSVCLIDESTNLAGMNHFLLPESIDKNKMYNSNSGHYGINAMELLINEMLFRGARRANLQAKVFGGGQVIEAFTSNKIPQSNIEFSLLFLKTEKIPVVSKDIGGKYGRKIFFYTKTGKVLVKKVGKMNLKQIEKEEISYKKRIVRKEKHGNFILFDRRL